MTEFGLSGQPLSINVLLDAWAAASAETEPIGWSERQRLRYGLGERHSAHELALIGEFRGPVEADDLRRRYSWTRAVASEISVRLTAEPRDPAEALFVPRFTVTLDRATHLPVAVEFTDRRTGQRGAPVPLATTRRLDALVEVAQKYAAPTARSQTVPLVQTVSHLVEHGEPQSPVPPPPAEIPRAATGGRLAP